LTRHRPLYRQEQIYWDWHQVWLPRQSMARWVQLASEWLKPIYWQIKDQMMRGSYIQVENRQSNISTLRGEEAAALMLSNTWS
jgi:hypothetical protein